MQDDRNPQIIRELSEEEVRRKARYFTYDIEDKLEKITKKVKPIHFVPYVINFFNNPKRNTVVAPHTYLQTIEANCAYYKEGYNEEITERLILKALSLNFQLENENHFYLWSINQNLDLFYQFINRIQMEVQKTGFYKRYIVRYWKLFYSNDSILNIFDEFLDVYGISIEKLFLCSISIHSLFFSSIVVSKNIKIPDFLNLCHEDIESFLKYSTYTLDDIKKRYIDIRKDTAKEFHFLIRSAFIERPILELPGDKIVAPIPELIYKHIGSSLTAMIEKVDQDGYYMGKSFENYVEIILKSLRSFGKLYTNKDLETLSSGDKNCDFLLAMQSENILIECKAIDFRVRTLTKNAISKSGATSRVIDAIKQLLVTQKNIREDKFSVEHVDLRKPFIHLIVTLDELPGYNSDWFFEEIIPSSNKRLSKELNDYLKSQRPLILSIDGLENLVVYLNSTDATLVDLCNEKKEKGDFFTGDWSTFLSNKIREKSEINELHFLDDTFDEIYEKLGITKEMMNSKTK